MIIIFRSIFSGLLVCCALPLHLLTFNGQAHAAQTDPQTPLGRNVQSLLSEQHKRGKFSGVAMVTSESEIDLEQGFGFSNRAGELSNAPDTCFKIGGITRSFTATAVLQLVGENRIGLGDPLEKFFPEIKNRATGKVTVQQLLTNTSGIPDYLRSWRQAWQMKFGEETPPRDGFEGVVRSILSESPSFAPGSRFEFSNSSYMILGQMIERASGEPYSVWLRRFLDEHGLGQTGIAIERETTESIRAVGYEALLPFDLRAMFSHFKRKPMQYRNTDWDLATSSMYSSGRDLQRWLEILGSDDILPDNLQELLFTPTVRINSKRAIGIGGEILDINGATLHAQVGAARGFYSIAIRNPATLSSVIVLSNFGESPAFRSKLLNELATLMSQ